MGRRKPKPTTSEEVLGNIRLWSTHIVIRTPVVSRVVGVRVAGLRMGLLRGRGVADWGRVALRTMIGRWIVGWVVLVVRGLLVVRV
jgi:hypothetical protein